MPIAYAYSMQQPFMTWRCFSTGGPKPVLGVHQLEIHIIPWSLNCLILGQNSKFDKSNKQDNKRTHLRFSSYKNPVAFYTQS